MTTINEGTKVNIRIMWSLIGIAVMGTGGWFDNRLENQLHFAKMEAEIVAIGEETREARKECLSKIEAQEMVDEARESNKTANPSINWPSVPYDRGMHNGQPEINEK